MIKTVRRSTRVERRVAGNPHGTTPLMNAVSNGDIGRVKTLFRS